MPPLNFQDSTEADGVIGASSPTIAAQAAKRHQHFRRLGGVTVTKLNRIIFPAFQPATPISRPTAVFNPLRAGGNPNTLRAYEYLHGTGSVRWLTVLLRVETHTAHFFSSVPGQEVVELWA